MSNITDFNKCKRILKNDFNSINDINKLLEYKVCLIDSYNFAFRYDEFGSTKESLERGFIAPVVDSAAKGFIAKEPFMSVNIPEAIKNINNRLDFLYFQANKIHFLDHVQKNETDLKIAESLKSDYEENEAMTLEELGKNVSVELANIMFKCGYSGWVFFKHNNLDEYKADIKNVLENDRDIDEVAESIDTTYDNLISEIEYAKENLENIEMFKVRDFYCEFSKEKNSENNMQLDIFINKNNELIKVNTLYVKDLDIDNAKKFVEETMCTEIGHITDDGKIEKEYYGQGYIYKNFENFYKREGICYVSEHDGETIEDGGISFEGICEEVCDYLILCGVDINKVPSSTIEMMAEEIFETVDWQCTSSLIEGDEYLSEYIEEFPDEYFIKKENEEIESR